MKNLSLIICLTLLISCSENISKKPENLFSIKRVHKHSPWKIINFHGYYHIKCPIDWKVSRDRTRVFIRPFEHKPIGIIIGMETNIKLNSLTLAKYFVHIYKKILIPRNIHIWGLEQTAIAGYKAVQFNYKFSDDFNRELKGFEILVKHKKRFYFIVAEAPSSKFDENFIKLKWVIDSIEFPK